MNTQHTPGPWTVKKASPQAGVITAPNRGLGIAEVFGGGETDTANARLIAAAPELLTALQHVIDQYDRARDFTQFMDGLDWKLIRGAAAKAKGGAL